MMTGKKQAKYYAGNCKTIVNRQVSVQVEDWSG